LSAAIAFMAAPSESPEQRWPRLWLRRTDQATVAVIVVIAIAAMIGHWLYHGGRQGQMIEVDRVEPGSIVYTVDLNSADWPELTVLPGVGETLAKRIVADRDQHGPFHDFDDLRRVRGIGPRTLERLTPYLRPIPDLEATADQAPNRKDS
jgi:competence protein ComEA